MSCSKIISYAAFTLSEVLITLGVIGVVAAITLPSLIQHHKEQVLYTSYMRVYNTLNQAYLKAQEEYGTFSNWEKTSEDDYNKMKPYLKIVADCPIGAKTLNKACLPDVKYKDYVGVEQANKYSTALNYQWPAVRLVSGESILFSYTSALVNFTVDLNGNKGPNQLGVDLHYFSFDEKNRRKIKPGPVYSSDYPNCCRKTNVTAWMPGNGCGYWIIRHRNMDYLHLSDKEITQKW